MKSVLVFFISCVILCVNFSYAHGLKKHHQIRYTFDTISYQNDSVLIKVNSYRNDTILHELTTFFFDDCTRVLFSRLPILREFRRKQFAYRFLKHGKEIYHDPNGKKIVINYNYGNVLKTEYLDSLGHEISREEFIGNNLVVDDWAKISPSFFMPKRMKCKKGK